MVLLVNLRVVVFTHINKSLQKGVFLREEAKYFVDEVGLLNQPANQGRHARLNGESIKVVLQGVRGRKD